VKPNLNLAIPFTRHALAGLCLAACAQGWAAPVQAPAAANLPQLGDVARVDLTPVQERRIGEEIMNTIRRDRDYLDDAPILEYLNEFGANLVAAMPGARGETNADYFFFAVRDPQLNAFALPGGFIAVHSALLIAAQNESELASVMSHEIGHVVQRHIARSIGQEKQDMIIPLATMVLAALAAKSNPDAAAGVYMGGQGLAIQRQLNFSREVEREADRVGFQIMGAAGFDTSGMVSFFGRLQAATRMFPDIPPSLLSHPLTSERIADIQARIRETPYRQRVDSLDFYLARARARVLQDETPAGRAEAQKAFAAMMNDPSRQQQVAGQYGMAFLTLKQGDFVKAQEWLDKARSAASAPPRPGVFSAAPPPTGNGAALFAALDIDIKLAPGQPRAVQEQALKAAERAQALFPLSRGIARQYADALVANGRLEDAAHYLRDQIRLYRSEPQLYDQLAKTYAEQGKIALQHLALAESYALTGGTMGALDQLKLARSAKDATFYDQAMIDARERELQAKRRDEMKEKKEGS